MYSQRYLLCAGRRPFVIFPSCRHIKRCSSINYFSHQLIPTSISILHVADTHSLDRANNYYQYQHQLLPLSRLLHQPRRAIIQQFSTATETQNRSRNMSPVQETSASAATDSPVVLPSTAPAKEVENIEASKPDEMEIENAAHKLYFVKLTEHASAPTKGSKYAAGYDLKSAYDAVVPKRGSSMVKTDIQVQLPSGTYGRIAPRSGLALKNKIDVGAGVVDEDYRGNVGVILFNHADEDFIVSKGDRIAQLICEKICYPEAVEVKSLEESERGTAGFGSTGGVKKMKMDENDKEN